MNIEHPHGYLKDSEGRVVIRFSNWTVGIHKVPNSVESVEYVDGSGDHEEPVHDEYRDVPS